MDDSQTDENPQDSEFNQTLADILQAVRSRLDEAKKRLRDEIIPQLKQHGIANVKAAYSGYGDSGAINDIKFRDGARKRIDRRSVPSTLIEQLESAVYEFLPEGFELDDGGQGTLTIEVETGKILLAHSDNETILHKTKKEWAV